MNITYTPVIAETVSGTWGRPDGSELSVARIGGKYSLHETGVGGTVAMLSFATYEELADYVNSKIRGEGWEAFLPSWHADAPLDAETGQLT